MTLNLFASAQTPGESQSRRPGTLVCWGAQIIPYFPPETRFARLSAGTAHNLGLTTKGELIGWGFNNVNQSTVPGDLGDFIAFDSGDEHNLVINRDGTVVAW